MLPLFPPGAQQNGGWDLTNAAYASKSKDISAQVTNPASVTFDSAGNRMYVTDQGNKVYQYTLSTPYDVSTASYASKSFTIEGTSNAWGFRFNDDGLKAYSGSNITDTLYQYTLSSAYDLSTITYASKSLDVSGQINVVRGFWMKPDGTAVYVVNQNDDTIYQYTLSTPWDLSTGSYASKSYSVTNEATNPGDLAIKPDGITLIVMNQNGVLYQYTLGTPWDISTATYASVTFSAATQDNTTGGIFINNDGDHLYITGDITDRVYQYDL